MLKVQIKLLRPKLYHSNGEPVIKLPGHATAMSAGVDLQAAIDAPMKLWPNEQARLIPTGISIFIGDPGYAAFIFPRSGLGHKSGLVLGNGTGVIDADYQGELFVSAWNRSPLSTQPIEINPGDRIAQMVFMPVAQVEQFVIVEEFKATERGAAGFGSTGVAA